jgi:hypothetical protein
VAVILPLTPPTGPRNTPPRTDIVYLDVWEREVGSQEDDNLINPVIGVETCVRLKREVAVRVTEGATTLPNAPAGHVFLPLALLRRHVDRAEITSQNIEDLRLFIHSPQGSREVSFFPAFLPVHLGPLDGPGRKLPEWRITFALDAAGVNLPKFHARKEKQQPGVAGVLPLILPDRARLRSFSIQGDISATGANLQWQLLRINHQFIVTANPREFFDVLAEDTIDATEPKFVIERKYPFSDVDPKLIVDNSRYYYALLAHTFVDLTFEASIHGVSIQYEYYGLVRPSGAQDPQ